jgi:hypothetical protein
MAGVAYFLKLVGLSEDPLPANWWDERPEIRDGVWFGRRPKAIRVGDTLIYYAVGTRGRLCAVAEVESLPTKSHPPPADWSAEQRRRFPWWMRVRVAEHIAADDAAPRAHDFLDRRIGAGSYQRLDERVGERMANAIRSHRRR